MHEIESELLEFCSEDWSDELVSLIKKRSCGFYVKSQENTHLWIKYENVYIAFNWDNDKSISFSTSGDDNIPESKRFRQDERVFLCLLSDLRKLKK